MRCLHLLLLLPLFLLPFLPPAQSDSSHVGRPRKPPRPHTPKRPEERLAYNWKREKEMRKRREKTVYYSTDSRKFEKILEETADDDGNIMISYTNSGFHNFTKNFLFSLENALPPISNVILFPLDCKEFKESLKLRVSSFFTGKEFNDTAQPFIGNPEEFPPQFYRSIVHYKWKLVLKVLEAGFNVLLSDVDVVWLRNPFSLISTMPSCDFYFYCSKNVLPKELSRCFHLNTGVMYFKSNNRTVSFIKRAMKTFNWFDDQTSVNKFLDRIIQREQKQQQPSEQYSLQDSPTLPLPPPPPSPNLDLGPSVLSGTCGQMAGMSFSRIPPYLVTNPRMVSEHVEELQTRPYAIHFNFLNGWQNKIRAMRERRMWLADEYREREEGKTRKEEGGGGCVGREFYLEAETETWV